LKQSCRSFSCRNIVSYILPFYSILASFYTLRAFLHDVIAGITMSILHVPQGMAYGYLAGLRPINGLYTSFFPPLVYFFFGTSRHISVGTFSVVALLSAAPVDRLAATLADVNITSNSTDNVVYDYRLKVAITVTLLSGLIQGLRNDKFGLCEDGLHWISLSLQFLMGLLRLGFLMVYISSPLLGGFTCASALHVIASQLNALFGVKMKRTVGPGILPLDFYNFILVFKETNVATITISVICITVLAIFKFLINPKIEAKIHFPFPVEVVVLILATTISHFAQLNQRFGVRIVGPLPQGLPKPVLPDLNLVPSIAVDSIIVSFVALATTVSLAKLYASKAVYDVKYTLYSYVSFLHLQVASLISCAVLVLVLTVIGPSLESVPMCVLSSIILVSLTGILGQIMEVPKLLRSSVIDAAERLPGIVILRFGGPLYYANSERFQNWVTETVGLDANKVYKELQSKTAVPTPSDRSQDKCSCSSKCCYRSQTLEVAVVVWIVTFLATVFIDVPLGLITGLVFSLVTVLCRTQLSTSYELGHIKDTDLYESRTLYTAPEEEPPLRPQLANAINIRFIILDISSWTFIDVVGAHTLHD
ncbi:hypothetical protein T265_15222, partial [Opisthorchis viverrini]